MTYKLFKIVTERIYDEIFITKQKVEASGSKKQLIEYVKEKYKDEFWVKENAKKFDTDFGSFKFTIETLGLELSDKMTNSEYNKTHRR